MLGVPPYAGKENCFLYYSKRNHRQEQFNFDSELPMIVQNGN